MAKLTISVDTLYKYFGMDKPFVDEIRSFVHSINPDIKVRLSYDEFYADCGLGLINVCLGRDELEDKIFDDFVKYKFGVSVNPFLMGILHEVFHIITFDEQLDYERDILYYMLQLNFKEDRWLEYSHMYFQIPAELMATEAAVNYYLTHKEYCDDFIKKIGMEKGEWQE